MEKSNELDIQKLNSIIKYAGNIKKCFERFGIENAEDFKNEEIEQAACT